MVLNNIVFEIKDMREESVLAILSALQAYEKNAFEKHAAFYHSRIGEGDLQLNIYLIRAEQYARFDFIWTKCLSHVKAISHDMWDVKIAGLITSCVILSEEVARDLARTSGKHLAQTYGIMVGSEAGSLPNVDALAPESYTPEDTLLIREPIQLKDVPEQIRSSFLLTSSDTDLHERVGACFACMAYAGELSFESYAMSALKKPVFEISAEPSYLLSKWSNPNYIRASISSDDAITRGMFQCLNRIQSGK